MYVHVNGDLVPEERATVSVRDRGFMYGDAAFETLRAYGGDVFEWEAHAERLSRTCDLLAIDHGLAREDLHARVHETLDANDLEDAYVRLSITRGVQPGTLTPDPDVDPTVVVLARGLPRGGRDGESTWADPARALIADTRRVANDAIPARAKTHNYLNGILARLECRESGADEALMLDADGHLAEGATSNVFFVREGVLHTPTLDGPVLPGITRSVVTDLAGAVELPTTTGRYLPADLLGADEAFLTNTTWEVRPVGSVGDEAIGAGPATEELAREFDDLVERRHY